MRAGSSLHACFINSFSLLLFSIQFISSRRVDWRTGSEYRHTAPPAAAGTQLAARYFVWCFFIATSRALYGFCFTSCPKFLCLHFIVVLLAIVLVGGPPPPIDFQISEWIYTFWVIHTLGDSFPKFEMWVSNLASRTACVECRPTSWLYHSFIHAALVNKYSSFIVFHIFQIFAVPSPNT